jgi:hypothetical protein
MAVVVVGILALAALAYVAGGLRSPGPPASAPAGPAEVELERRARAALVAIVDLENERDTGKLRAGDFDALVGTYEDEALEALRDLDEVRSAAGVDAVEREIAAVRARLRSRPSRSAARPSPPRRGEGSPPPR